MDQVIGQESQIETFKKSCKGSKGRGVLITPGIFCKFSLKTAMIHTGLASCNLILWRVVASYGHDPQAIFDLADLDTELMNNPWARYPLDVVDRRLPAIDEQLLQIKDQLLMRQLEDLAKDNFIMKIRKLISEHLASGNVTIKIIADEMHMSSRTIQRMLSKENTTFAALLDEVRVSLAKQFLNDVRTDLTEIAFLLGFSELSTFSRAFKRLTGQSPSQYRSVANLAAQLSG